jgi:S-adenosylmethionine decarboxylase proenzyme
VKTEAIHLLVEMHGCDPQLLDDVDGLLEAMSAAVRAAGATEIGRMSHRFAPQGVSAVIMVAESHFSIHTWPEAGYAAVDFYTCGDCRPELAAESLANSLNAARFDVTTVHRGHRLEREPTLGVGVID